MYHLDKAGFAFEVATLSGNPVKFEWWAMPTEDEAVVGLYGKYQGQFRQPAKLADLLAQVQAPDSDYLGVFIPGGHGALLGLPESAEVKALLEWAMAHERFIITLCHGPAALLAVANSHTFAGYQICAFPMRWMSRRRRSATCRAGSPGSLASGSRGWGLRSSTAASRGRCAGIAIC